MNAQITTVESPDEAELLANSRSAEAIRDYLALMEDTESPRVYHLWSLITASAALIGQNACFQSGQHTVQANLFTVLLGPAGVRKSSAIKHIARLLEGSSIHFGPTDTGGQRHGLMSAMSGFHRPSFRKFTLENIVPLDAAMIHPRPPSDMTLLAPELGRLLGSGSREMADFFVDLWDGARIDYQTKVGETILRKPLVTMLGATTPANLSSILPDGSVGHGILSRILFIYDDQIYKTVPLPPEPTEEWNDLRESIRKRFKWIDGNRSNFCMLHSARATYADLYTYRPTIEDPRLDSYRERRAEILLKVAMCLCALRTDTAINSEDLQLSHVLLTTAEPTMHKALEHFGRNRIFSGRMLIIQYLKNLGRAGSATVQELTAAAASELTQREAEEAVQTMLNSGELRQYRDRIMLADMVELKTVPRK